MDESEPLVQPASDSAAIVQRIFRRAVERVGSVSALAVEIRVPYPEIRLYVAGEAAPPMEILPRHRENAHPLRAAQAAQGNGRGSGKIMSSQDMRSDCAQAELVCAYALQTLPPAEAAAVEAHVATCPHCSRELEGLRPLIDSFAAWPRDVLRAPAWLQRRLASRIAAESGTDPVLPNTRRYIEPEWEQVAAGIECKLLAKDEERHMISMLVRLAPGAEYPPHEHAGIEELHLLDGELWIDERMLITSTKHVLR